MKITGKLTASVLVAGLSLGLGSTALVAISAGDALAKSTQGSDHSSGKSQGAERSSAKSDNASSKSNGNAGGNSSASKGKSATAGLNGRGALASQLKNLNAMCANGKAFANASDNSNIGKMRIYKTKLLAADALRSDLSGLGAQIAANDPDVDTSNLDAQGVQDQIASLSQAKADATWPNGSDAYTGALADYAAGLDPAVDPADLSEEQLADFNSTVVEPHNAGVAAQYDPQIADLQAYAAKLGEVATAEDAENAALTTATRGRDLSDEALTTFQTAMRDGC